MNVHRQFDAFPWADVDDALLQAWQQGRTGIPLVDAGMRQLWTTGWMHNRVRMVTASFLIKNLRYDWRIGERWFWDTLVDADPANNAAQWQWVAGSGRGRGAVLPGVQPGAAGAEVRPGGRVHRPLGAGAAPPRRERSPRAVDGERRDSDAPGYPAPVVDLKAFPPGGARRLPAHAGLNRPGPALPCMVPCRGRARRCAFRRARERVPTVPPIRSRIRAGRRTRRSQGDAPLHDDTRAAARHAVGRTRSIWGGVGRTILVMITVLAISSASVAAYGAWRLSEKLRKNAVSLGNGNKIPNVAALSGGFNVMLVGEDNAPGQHGLGFRAPVDAERRGHRRARRRRSPQRGACSAFRAIS